MAPVMSQDMDTYNSPMFTTVSNRSLNSLCAFVILLDKRQQDFEEYVQQQDLFKWRVPPPWFNLVTLLYILSRLTPTWPHWACNSRQETLSEAKEDKAWLVTTAVITIVALLFF